MKNEEEPKRVQYKVSEIKIKTAFDMDTKTQHRAFFIFGEPDFDAAVREMNGTKLDAATIDRFRSLLRQRKDSSEKLPRDPEKINKRLAKALPEDIHDHMLAYYHKSKEYLTYTRVPQKPYRLSPRNILKDTDKLACGTRGQLCPACQMFGTASLTETDDADRKMTAIKGKLSVTDGLFMKNVSCGVETVTIKPLGSPKPTYYPFYIIDNRGGETTTQRFHDYDQPGIRIGRKVYLHHDPEMLDYHGADMSNLNATIRPIPAGAKFQIEIDFANLTNYELGLLLYSLDMRYRDEACGYHIGMGKSIGLGSCNITLKEVTLFDMLKHYSGLNGGGERELSPGEIRMFQNMYKFVQAAQKEDDFRSRQEKANGFKKPLDPGAVDLPGEERIRTDYFACRTMDEFHILKSINIHPRFMTRLPILFAGGREKGFEWYQEARGKRLQCLFDPADLEKGKPGGGGCRVHSLTS